MQYELVVVVDPRLSETEAQSKLATLLEKEGFTVSGSDFLGKKSLGYPIKKQTQGYFFSFVVSADPARPKSLQGKFKLDDTILRWLIIKKEGNDKSKVKN